MSSCVNWKSSTEPAVRECLLDRIEIFALDVFDERHLEERLIAPRGDLLHDDRHAQQARALGRAPAALAGDDLKAIADLAHDDRLNDAVRRDRPRQLLEPRIVDRRARLKLVRRQAIDVDLGRRRAELGRVGNERAQSFAESGAFVHVDHQEMQPRDPKTRRKPKFPFRDFVFSCLHSYAAVAADRSSISRASARYASAPRDFTSYSITGMP